MAAGATHLVFCGAALALLVTAAGSAHSSFVKLAQMPDGFTVHNVIASWSEAQLQCQSEGAILASPINERVLDAMRSWMNVTGATYYVGTAAAQHTGHFVSLEGVPLESMPVYLWQQLDAWLGDCLAMTSQGVRVVPCDSRLPYMCYNSNVFNNNKTNCDPGYKYEPQTKHCYKVHTDDASWYSAHKTCLAEGGYLAVIDNDDEAQIITHMYTGPEPHVWIGILDYTGKGDWISIHWQPIEELYHVWQYVRKPSIGTCGLFVLPGKLNSATSCASIGDFICEKEPSY